LEEFAIMKLLARCILPLLFLAATASAATQPGSIGYVDMQVILDKSAMGKEAQATLKEKFSGRQAEFAEEEQEIRRLQGTLQRDQALMSQAELDKKKAELQERVKKLQQKGAKAQRELLEEQNKLGKAILGPAEAIITAVAKEKKVSAVFERHQSGLLYIDQALDLTAEVIKRLDAKKKK
jgi:outer membrane protein